MAQEKRQLFAPVAMNADRLLALAQNHHQRGEFSQAAALYRRVLLAQPLNVDAMQLLGVTDLQLGHYADAATMLQNAIQLAPAAPSLHCNLGLAFHQLQQFEQAEQCYARALALRPDFAEALNNRGNTLRELKRVGEAIDSFQRAVQLRPDFADALFNLGCARLAGDQPGAALDYLTRCLQVAPQHPGALGQSGMALMKLQRPQEALACFERRLQHDSNDAEAHFWRGNALLPLGRPADAVASYRQAVQLRPDLAELHYSLGTALLEMERPNEALPALAQALRLRPDYPEALYNRGGALQELRRHEDAIVDFERLLSVAPDHRFTPGRLFHSRQMCCTWQHYASDVHQLTHIANGAAVRDMPFSFLAVTADAALQQSCARAYTALKHPAPVAAAPLAARRTYRHQRIRIAYVSADFREHPITYLLAGVFEHHDRDRFETVAISLRPQDGSATSRRVASAFERFVDASTLRDEQIAALLGKLEADIAVDLMGYTENNRTSIFAQRPAPVQVNYLGFPGTMGADYIDYIIADDFVIPATTEGFYTERVVRLPNCFQGNDDKRPIAQNAPNRVQAGLPESGFVFCAFNNVYKFNPPLFATWMRMLRAVPDSVLWIAADAPTAQRNLLTEASRHGVDAQRLIFAPRIPYAAHLTRLQLADLFLDTMPFNAGTTASDALWAGLPVLTCCGESLASRMAGSLLTALGLPELITYKLDDYEALAIKLASMPGLLRELRARLQENRSSKPLFDTAGFCRHLEAAYVTMWERSERGDMPVSFHVPAS